MKKIQFYDLTRKAPKRKGAARPKMPERGQVKILPHRRGWVEVLIVNNLYVIKRKR